MNGTRVVEPATGFGMVFLVALLGLALAALVVLTPWHLSDLPGGDDRRPNGQHEVVNEPARPRGNAVVPVVVDNAR